MGVPAAVVYGVMAAATAYSVYTTQQSGKQAALNADAQSDQAQADADNAASAARVQADRIRKMARINAGSANASLAASGVEVGEGSAININQDIYGNAEEDAALTIFNADEAKKRGYVDASNLSLAGQQARSQANSQSIGTVLQAGASMGMDWKRSVGRNATTPTVGGNG